MERHSDFRYGTVLRHGLIAGLTLTESAYSSRLQLPEHFHKSAYFCFVLQGGFTEADKRDSHPCKPATLIYRPSFQRHSDQFGVATRCFNILPSAELARRAPQLTSNAGTATYFRDAFLAQLTNRLYKEFQQTDELSALVIEGLFIEILGEAARSTLKNRRLSPPAWLKKARELLHDQFQESLTLATIAETVGVHQTQLCREFRRHYRQTAGEYVRQLRVDFASRKLSSSNTPISEIALDAGFADQCHFAKTFKKHIGMSPAEYRRTFRIR